MKVDRTKYTAHYENGVVVAQWISVEMALDGENGESPLTALDRSQQLVDEWYKKQNIPPFFSPPVYDGNSFPGPRIIEKNPEDREIGVTVESIMSCQDIVTLQTYYMLVEKLGKQELKEAYAFRKSQLVTNETKAILAATNALTGEFNKTGQ